MTGVAILSLVIGAGLATYTLFFWPVNRERNRAYMKMTRFEVIAWRFFCVAVMFAIPVFAGLALLRFVVRIIIF